MRGNSITDFHLRLLRQLPLFRREEKYFFFVADRQGEKYDYHAIAHCHILLH